MTITNSQFAANDQVFKKACEIAHVNPTKRQASKFRRKRGLAFICKAEAVLAIKKENENKVR